MLTSFVVLLVLVSCLSTTRSNCSSSERSSSKQFNQTVMLPGKGTVVAWCNSQALDGDMKIYRDVLQGDLEA